MLRAQLRRVVYHVVVIFGSCVAVRFVYSRTDTLAWVVSLNDIVSSS